MVVRSARHLCTEANLSSLAFGPTDTNHEVWYHEAVSPCYYFLTHSFIHKVRRGYSVEMKDDSAKNNIARKTIMSNGDVDEMKWQVYMYRNA